MMKDYLTPKELAAHLNVKTQTLSQWRYYGREPKYIKVGGEVRYPLDLLKEYEHSLILKTEQAMKERKAKMEKKSHGHATA